MSCPNADNSSIDLYLIVNNILVYIIVTMCMEKINMELICIHLGDAGSKYSYLLLT